MSKKLIINIIRFIILVFLQVFVLNKIHIGGYVNPYLYILFILLFPIESPKWLQLLSAFLMGFCIDVFMQTIGINMAASVFIAWMRPGLIKSLMADKDDESNLKPGIRDFGFKGFLIYASILTLCHHLILFYLETFKFTHFLTTLKEAVLSSLLTLFLIILTQYLFMKPSKN
ncbi:MAG: rod shape-determining protein MreD [Bacteroidales bacterium]|nr:rod shape-determining protein MreD [Bacteroidales bacterium]MCF8387170.1 rod shape-determining protein MreD [Bacteroidales bacterium]MCF8397662.1 rod shape-determining protein MreD [Bacteroidales bacterium]